MITRKHSLLSIPVRGALVLLLLAVALGTHPAPMRYAAPLPTAGSSAQSFGDLPAGCVRWLIGFEISGRPDLGLTWLVGFWFGYGFHRPVLAR